MCKFDVKSAVYHPGPLPLQNYKIPNNKPQNTDQVPACMILKDILPTTEEFNIKDNGSFAATRNFESVPVKTNEKIEVSIDEDVEQENNSKYSEIVENLNVTKEGNLLEGHQQSTGNQTPNMPENSGPRRARSRTSLLKYRDKLNILDTTQHYNQRLPTQNYDSSVVKSLNQDTLTRGMETQSPLQQRDNRLNRSNYIHPARRIMIMNANVDIRIKRSDGELPQMGNIRRKYIGSIGQRPATPLPSAMIKRKSLPALKRHSLQPISDKENEIYDAFRISLAKSDMVPGISATERAIKPPRILRNYTESTVELPRLQLPSKSIKEHIEHSRALPHAILGNKKVCHWVSEQNNECY